MSFETFGRYYQSVNDWTLLRSKTRIIFHAKSRCKHSPLITLVENTPILALLRMTDKVSFRICLYAEHNGRTTDSQTDGPSNIVAEFR